MTAPEPRVQVTEYAVTCLPESHIDAPHFTVTVAYRGEGKWAVLRGGRCYANDGSGWSHESLPSGREDDWLATHRWSEAAALETAAALAPTLFVNGYSLADVLAWDPS